MRALPAWCERVFLFVGVYLLWLAVYLAVGRIDAARPAAVLLWDPVWSFPRVSAFVVPYLSAYLMPFILLFVVRDRAAFRRLAAMLSAVILFSAAIFLLWPLRLPRDPLAPTTTFDGLLGGLYAADRPTNLFPSLHVSMAFLFALAIGQARPRWRPWTLAWATLIAASTLFIRQHYLIDVLGGVAVAWVAWRAYLRLARA